MISETPNILRTRILGGVFLFWIVFFLIACNNGKTKDVGSKKYDDTAFTPLSTLEKAFNTQQSDLQVLQRGEIIRILSDDTKGSKHQRFIVKLSSGQTLLIAHNIDLAPRIPDIRTGESLVFYGEYEWNEKGGVIHWTHHDPDGRHVGGWLEYRGKKYS